MLEFKVKFEWKSGKSALVKISSKVGQLKVF